MEALDVRSSRPLAIRTAALLALFTSLSAWIATHPDISNRVIGLVCGTIFACGVLAFGTEAIRLRHRVRIDERGITVNQGSVKDFFIPWSEIDAVRRIHRGKIDLLALILVDDWHYLAQAPLLHRMFHRANQALLGSSLFVAPSLFPITLDEMEEAVRRYHPELIGSKKPI